MQEDNRDHRLYPSPLADGPGPTLSTEASQRQQLKCLQSEDVMLQHSSPGPLPDPETATGSGTHCSYAEALLAPSLPQPPAVGIKQLCPRSDYGSGECGQVGVGVLPGPGPVTIFDLFCIISPASSECQN